MVIRRTGVADAGRGGRSEALSMACFAQIWGACREARNARCPRRDRDAKSQKTTFTHDVVGRLAQRVEPDMTSVCV